MYGRYRELRCPGKCGNIISTMMPCVGAVGPKLSVWGVFPVGVGLYSTTRGVIPTECLLDPIVGKEEMTVWLVSLFLTRYASSGCQFSVLREVVISYVGRRFSARAKVRSILDDSRK